MNDFPRNIQCQFYLKSRKNGTILVNLEDTGVLSKGYRKKGIKPRILLENNLKSFQMDKSHAV